MPHLTITQIEIIRKYNKIMQKNIKINQSNHSIGTTKELLPALTQSNHTEDRHKNINKNINPSIINQITHIINQ
jgi:hypothetical protein